MSDNARDRLLPPIAKKDATVFSEHGRRRVDDYYWLSRRGEAKVVEYLQAENDYTAAQMADTSELQDRLYREIKERIKQSDVSVPYHLGGFYYYTRYSAGAEYPVFCRKKGALEAAEEVILDVNVLAEGHAFFQVGRRAVSSDQQVLAFAVDTVGRRFYTIRFKNLTTGETLADEISDVTGSMAWANDNKTFFYAKQDPITLRSHRIYRHTLGTGVGQDELVYEEQDATFSTSVHKSKSKNYIFIESHQTMSTEYRYLHVDNPLGNFEIFEPRQRGHEYDVHHFGDHFYVVTNDNAKNFRLMKTPIVVTARSHWQEVVAHREQVLLDGIELFRDHFVLSEREAGLTRLRVLSWDKKVDHYIHFDEPAYEAYVSTNLELDTCVLRFGYESMTTPNSIFDYDMTTCKRELKKRTEVLGGFDPKHYVTERVHGTADDGAKIPISLVYHRKTTLDGAAPLLLYGYGSYGYSLDAGFSMARLSLLDRGFIYAIAHVRGGQELGREWYENGKLFKKKNSFTDFVACAEHLVANDYTNREHVFAMGGSAGGLLVGAVINMRPDLFKGVVAQVPFVDVINTMLDDSIPLTTGEYDEWGDPNDKKSYEYIASYSPYDNVAQKNYPHLLVTSGLYDSQVQYWEPTKWVAKLRAQKQGDNILLLRTNMEAGHGGTTGRFKRIEEVALEYAFLLRLAGITR